MNNKGTLITSPIRPFSSGDTFAVAYSNEIKGGFHTKYSLNEMYDIPVERREEGMLCTIITSGVTSGSTTSTTYQLLGGIDNSNWVVYSGSGGSISIEDEGVLISNNSTTLNFVGASVRAQLTGGKINVYIPPPNYVSHFNTSDGVGNANVSNFSTTLRYIPDPSGNFDIGDWSYGSSHTTVRKNTVLTYSPSGNFSILNNSGTTLTATVYGADGVSILAQNQIILSGNTNITNQNITLQVINFSTDGDKYKADVNVSININNILPTGGRFSISLVHNNLSDGIFTFSQNNVFLDTEDSIVVVNGPLTMNEGSNVLIKKISGVEFYTYDTEWLVDLNDVDNLNDRSYPLTQQVSIYDTNFLISENLDINGQNTSYYQFNTGTWSNVFNNQNSSFTKNDWKSNQRGHNWDWNTDSLKNTFITSDIYDWSLDDTLNSTNYNYLIDTLQDLSDRNSEMFISETYRLNSGLTSWDSNTDLSLVDGGNGLQVLFDRLVYPSKDFSLYYPNIGSQPSYTGLTGDKFYYREFETNGNSISNGVIIFSDHNITESDLSTNDVKFDISIDNGNSWFSLNLPYIGGVLSDGSGCRVDNSNYGLGSGISNDSALKFTLGLGGTSTQIYFRITYSQTAINKYIGGIDITEGNWI